jgi:hypothetical protein
VAFTGFNVRLAFVVNTKVLLPFGDGLEFAVKAVKLGLIHAVLLWSAVGG